MGLVLVQACKEADFDAATQACAHPFWTVYNPSPFPPLTLDEAALIGVAIIAAWAVGAGFKALYRAGR